MYVYNILIVKQEIEQSGFIIDQSCMVTKPNLIIHRF